MANRSTPPEPRPANLGLAEIKRVIPRLQKRVADLEAFDPSNLQERRAPEITALQASIDETLTNIFGRGSHEFRRYQSAARLDDGPTSIAVVGVRGRVGGPDLTFRQYLDEGKRRSIALLQQAIRGLEERATELDSVEEEATFEEPASSGPPPRRVFVVHGHDGAPREAVARFLERMEFEAIILHERPNKGRPLITKLREEAEGVGFAVVLMTPDDEGAEAGEKPQPRARQNVIFELGFFIGAIGPARVAAIVVGDVERPSDYDGVAYIPYEADWKTQLAKELREAGFEIDWNVVMR
jgi:predicted nucleotide-binding protein